jgi:hypothetical protein
LETYEYLKGLYNSLINRTPNYDARLYKWELGVEVIRELCLIDRLLPPPYNAVTLFDIKIEINYKNPSRIALHKNITYEL